jgi:hypothetical protein
MRKRRAESRAKTSPADTADKAATREVQRNWLDG